MNFRSLFFTLAAATTIVGTLAAADPGSITTYYAPDSRITPAVQSLLAASAGTVNFAANDLTDPAITGSLAATSTRGVTVTACLNLSGGTARTIAANTLAAAGVTVYSSTMSNLIGNHVLTVDGGTCAIGNYYWSPTALQVGNYLAIVAEPTVTSQQNDKFAVLVASATLTASPPAASYAAPPPVCGCLASLCTPPASPAAAAAPPSTFPSPQLHQRKRGPVRRLVAWIRSRR
jgi:hypothetical protein